MPKQRASLRDLSQQLRSQGPAADEHPIDALSAEGRQVINIPLEAITPNPNQPRKHFDESALRELSESIRTRGLLQPIIVKRQEEGRYLLVAGERRYRAAGMAGMKKIPALVTEGDELEIAIVENLQREDLKPLEESEALKALAGRFGYTQDALARVVGKSKATISESLVLLDLPERIKAEVRTSEQGSKSQLLQVVRESNPEKQLALWDAIKAGKLTVRAAREARQQKETRGRPKHASKTIRTTFPVEATVTVRFNKPNATEQEVWDALAAASAEQSKALEPPDESHKPKHP